MRWSTWFITLLAFLISFQLIWYKKNHGFYFCLTVKCLNLGRCIIYMPRIDLWAINKVHEQETEDHVLNVGTSTLAPTPIKNSRKCSEVWNALVDQMGSLLASVSISVLVSFYSCPMLLQFFSLICISILPFSTVLTSELCMFMTNILIF